MTRVRSRILQECRTGYHVLHALLFDLLHVSLVLEHVANILNFRNVALARFLKLLVFLLNHFFIHFGLGVVRVVLGVRLTVRIVFLYSIDNIEALLDFLQEVLRGIAAVHTSSCLLVIICHIKELASTNLVEAVALARVLVEHFIDKFAELVGVWDALEYFPV